MTSQSVVRRILAKPSGWIPALWLVSLILAALVGGWFLPHDPNDADFQALFQAPSWDHPFGTDELGRDTLARLVDASRVALIAGVQAVGIGLAIGVPIGLFVGYRGGWWDQIVMRLVDAVFSLPGLILAFAIVAILGPGLTNAMIAVGFLFSLRFIRLTRGSVLSVREEPFIEAARLSGAPTSRVLRSYLLPNVSGPLIVQISISFAAVLLIEAGLSFLGLGVETPKATWGTMLREARANQSESPWLPWPPGVAITLTVLAFNTLGDRLRDVLADDPVTHAAASAADAGVPGVLPSASVSAVVDTAGWSVDDAAERSGQSVVEEVSDLVESDALLQVRHLDVVVPTGSGPARAVRDLSFDVAAGEVVALVGESGSGKTLSAMTIAGLLPRRVSAVGNSSVRLGGLELIGRTDEQLRTTRGKQMSMIFQDPMSSLNPSLTIGYQLAEPLREHLGLGKAEARERAADLLDRVGVPDPRGRLGDYPHQFSGGMAQRVMISMALAAEPALLIADEPTTALDVTTQRQVLELLVGACEEAEMAMLFITHDLGVVAEIADRAVVMYAGQSVETGDVFEVFDDPQHPYTEALLGSVALMDQSQSRLVTIPGRVAGPAEQFPGCRFADRCSIVTDVCRHTPPSLIRLAGHGRSVRCVAAAPSGRRGAGSAPEASSVGVEVSR